ncbi:DNA polymerase III subunit gamma and tau [Intrasporangium sp.]|uniref:DNA polymerase III subunit gamma and tau n=1 Tax=Intrasporangium sp. TaxID=1925024 RepID=UPI00336596FB
MATALYRRYRPERFADVIGQEHVTEPLMQALRTGRVGHAYLFSGPRGCGKTTSARILARCLNCEQGPTPEPCGECDSCVALARGGPGSVDVIEIDAASHGGVDDARDLRERASYGPAQSRYKIYIIDEAHMVTPQGFNALLKIVEEPPEHVKFVFATTEPEKVIGTIRSRTHHYPFRLVPPVKLTAYMEHLLEQEDVPVAPGVLSFVVRAGGGSVRDSLSVLDQLIAGSGPEGLTYESAVSLLGFTDGELLDATIDALAAGDGAATFRQVDKVIESGHDPRRFIEDLLERLRDLIIVAAVPEPGQVLRGTPEDQLERMRVQQAAFGPGALSRAADIVNTGLTEMTGATAPRMQLELICARILLPAASGEQGFAARLDRLERRLEVGGVPSGAGGSAAPAPSVRMPPSSPPPAPAVPASTPPSSVQHAPPPAPSSVQHAPPPAPLSVQDAPPPAPSSVQDAPPPAAMDTDAIRRAWPQVLGRIFGMRRGTWTFVSQHAKVMAYDGKTLTLGISTAGLTNAFRAGNHADIVRQALIDELGVEAVIDGVHVADAGESAAVAPPAGAVRPAPEPVADAGPPAPTGRSLEDNAGWGSATAAAPDWATSAAPPAAPGAGAVRESLDAARRGASGRSGGGADDASSVTDDAGVSDDDEDIELSGDVGRSVIEKVLGGRVISESEE